jgi:ribonucleotide reductase alpha subunit
MTPSKSSDEENGSAIMSLADFDWESKCKFKSASLEEFENQLLSTPEFYTLPAEITLDLEATIGGGRSPV